MDEIKFRKYADHKEPNEPLISGWVPSKKLMMTDPANYPGVVWYNLRDKTKNRVLKAIYNLLFEIAKRWEGAR